MMPKQVSYQYIYATNKGYRIIKDNEHYGYYEDLADALYDRDRFIYSEWDFDVFVQLPDTPNPYKDIELPPFMNKSEYITHIPEKWRVQKKINDKVCYFGTYDSFEEAEARRNYLMEHGWCIDE